MFRCYASLLYAYSSFSLAPSGPPTRIAVVPLSSTSILVTWHDLEPFDLNGILTAFILVITDSTGVPLPSVSLPPTSYSYHREG